MLNDIELFYITNKKTTSLKRLKQYSDKVRSECQSYINKYFIKEDNRNTDFVNYISMLIDRFPISIDKIKTYDDYALLNYITEIVEPLVICYKEITAVDDCIYYLQKILDEHPRASVVFVVAEFIRQEKGLDEAVDFVSEKFSKYPSIRGLNRLIFWHLESAHGKVREKLQMLHDITSKFIVDKPVYRCGHCGFGGKHLHWHCPSCKQWGKMKPIHGLEGD